MVNPEEKPQDGVIALDNIDDLLAQSDPGFTDSLKEIATDPDLKSGEIESLSLDEKLLEDQDHQEEKQKKLSESYPRLYRFVIAPFQRRRAHLAAMGLRFRNRLLVAQRDLRLFFTTGLPERIQYLKKTLRGYSDRVKKLKADYRRASRAQKTKAWGVAGLVGLTGTVLYLNLRGPWLPQFFEDIPPHLAIYSGEMIPLSSGERFVPFSQAFPAQTFPVRLKSFVVNLKRRSMGENPMAFFDFELVADNQATAIELIDREKEMLDRMQRSVEGLTLPDVMGEAGSQRVKRTVKTSLNEILNSGRVLNVYVRMNITKQ